MEDRLIKVAICDDEIPICSEIESAVLAYSQIALVIFDTEIYYTGASLWKNLEGGASYDILFLDIELTSGFSGVDIGRRIRETMQNEALQIIYVSSHKKYALELFKTRPLDFLIKPVTADMVRETLGACLRILERTDAAFSYKQGREMDKVPVKSILYFKGKDREVMMVTARETVTFYGSLEDTYSRLEKYRFFYVHKSYLVNYMHVKEFHYDKIEMSNGDTIKIAQNRRKAVRELQKKYLLMETGYDD